jgi:GTP-binding protein Era
MEIVPLSLKEQSDGSRRLEMDILVRSDSVRQIVVGRRGAAIGSVGRSARLELENMWKRRVHLFLNVKVA